MKNFNYIARDPAGELVKGLKSGDSRQDVLMWLREQSFIAISVDQIDATKAKKNLVPFIRKSIKAGDMSELCWQLATMIEGGVTLIDAVNTLAGDIENKELQKTLQEISEKMQKGQTFSETLDDYPNIFDRLSCSMILAGETSGSLTMALEGLAEQYGHRDRLTRKVKSAMSYPVFVLGFIILIVIAVMTFIIPRFRVVFDQFGGDLPRFTEIFIGLYDGIMNNILYIMVALVLIITACLLWFKTKKGYRQFCRIVLAIPLVGKIIRQAFVVLFCRTMSSLLSSGVSVLDAITILMGMTKNEVIKSAIQRTKDHIVEGANISLSMAASGFFPSMAVKMTQVGEESGSLPKVLDRTSDFFEKKVEGTISSLTSTLEPILIITVGVIVLAVVLALYLPIFSISKIGG